MGKNKINLFEKAIQIKELDKFLLGEGEYYVPDRDYGRHWNYGSYKLYIEPYFQIFPNSFWFELLETLNLSTDKNLIIDNLIGYLIPYYNCSNKEILKTRVDNTPLFAINTIKIYIINNKISLLNDKRGTGTEWNSKNGLWESIIRNLEVIKKRSGINFVPNDNTK